MTPELRALGLSLEVLALRVERGDRVPPAELESAAGAVELAGPDLSDPDRLWLHGQEQQRRKNIA